MWFRVLSGAAFPALLWAAYQLRVRQLHRQFAMTLEARVGERTRIARELHDTLLQSFHGVLLGFVVQVWREFPWKRNRRWTERLIRQPRRSPKAGMRCKDHASLRSRERSRPGCEFPGRGTGANPANNGSAAFRVTVEGEPRDLNPILRDEIYRIAVEALRNAFHHAQARQIEVEIRYDDEQFRLHIRDDGKGMDPAVLAKQARSGHYGLPGMRERAKLVGGR